MLGEKQRIEGKGATLVFIGNGSPTNAAEFKADYRVDAPVYVDPSLRAYRALGLRPKGGLLKALKSAPRALAAGHLQGRVKGDAMQVGGVFVVDTSGAILFEHKGEAAGDHPSPEDILAAL